MTEHDSKKNDAKYDEKMKYKNVNYMGIVWENWTILKEFFEIH